MDPASDVLLVFSVTPKEPTDSTTNILASMWTRTCVLLVILMRLTLFLCMEVQTGKACVMAKLWHSSLVGFFYI